MTDARIAAYADYKKFCQELLLDSVGFEALSKLKEVLENALRLSSQS